MTYDQQSVKYYLPVGVSQGADNLVNAVTKTLDDVLEIHYDYWTNFDSNPMTCDRNLLDYFATNGSNPWRTLWRSDWEETTKRLLLRDTKIIFQRRLFPDTVTLLFSHFGLRSRLVPKNGFILAKTPLPATLGNSILDYQVELPSIYKGLTEEKYTEFIVNNFGIPGTIAFVYVDS